MTTNIAYSLCCSSFPLPITSSSHPFRIICAAITWPRIHLLRVKRPTLACSRLTNKILTITCKTRLSDMWTSHGERTLYNSLLSIGYPPNLLLYTESSCIRNGGRYSYRWYTKQRGHITSTTPSLLPLPSQIPATPRSPPKNQSKTATTTPALRGAPRCYRVAQFFCVSVKGTPLVLAAQTF